MSKCDARALDAAITRSDAASVKQQLLDADTAAGTQHELTATDVYSVGRTALHTAADSGHVHIAELLLAAGAAVDAGSGSGAGTALQAAARQGHADMVSLLLSAGAFTETTDSAGLTPLMCAAIYSQPHIVQLLLQAGANINTMDNYGDSALTCAVRPDRSKLSRILECVQVLVAAGAAVNSSSNGSTALHKAANLAADGVVAALLSAGAEVNAHDSSDRTPLWFSIQNNAEPTTGLLLDAGAAVEADCGDYSTPLMLAGGDGGCGKHATAAAAAVGTGWV